MDRFNRVLRGWRIGALALALLLSASLGWAATIEESVSGDCVVVAVTSGEMDLDIVASGGSNEEWVEFSIGLDSDGFVSIDGMCHGMLDMRESMCFEVDMVDGVATITVTDDETGEILWMHAVAYGDADAVKADGSVEFLDVE